MARPSPTAAPQDSSTSTPHSGFPSHQPSADAEVEGLLVDPCVTSPRTNDARGGGKRGCHPPFVPSCPNPRRRSRTPANHRRTCTSHLESRQSFWRSPSPRSFWGGRSAHGAGLQRLPRPRRPRPCAAATGDRRRWQGTSLKLVLKTWLAPVSFGALLRQTGLFWRELSSGVVRRSPPGGACDRQHNTVQPSLAPLDPVPENASGSRRPVPGWVRVGGGVAHVTSVGEGCLINCEATHQACNARCGPGPTELAGMTGTTDASGVVWLRPRIAALAAPSATHQKS